MITANSIKRLAYAITKVSKLNTSFHHYLKTEHPDSVIKNGQALQLISKAFGYKTHKGFTTDLDNGLVDASKLEILKSLNINIYIDDKYENFKEANNAGITTYLMDSQSNKYYNVGARRIFDLKISSIL